MSAPRSRVVRTSDRVRHQEQRLAAERRRWYDPQHPANVSAWRPGSVVVDVPTTGRARRVYRGRVVRLVDGRRVEEACDHSHPTHAEANRCATREADRLNALADRFPCCDGDPGRGHDADCLDADPPCSTCGRDYEGCECEDDR